MTSGRSSSPRGTATGSEAPKQYEPLGGRRVLDWSLDDGARRLRRRGARRASPTRVADAEATARPTWSSPAAPTRSASVRAGLAAVPDEADVVVVHDAARPLARPELWQAVIDAVASGADACGSRRFPSPTRCARWAAAPSTAPGSWPCRHRRRSAPTCCGGPTRASGEATDDAALVEAIGGRIVVVDGEPDNIKITTPADLRLVAGLAPGA